MEKRACCREIFVQRLRSGMSRDYAIEDRWRLSRVKLDPHFLQIGYPETQSQTLHTCEILKTYIKVD